MTPRYNKPPRQGERGFALLFVFALAAMAAVFLYMAAPRAAFEAERAREERLVQIGREYKRGIQLYVRKNKGYPQTLDDLDKTQNVHFIRRRYSDPMTGKDEWRLIHVNNMGQFYDSVTLKPDEKDKDKSVPNSFISEAQHVGEEPASTQAGQTNIALRTRPSDRPGAPGSGGPSNGLQFDPVGIPGQQGGPTGAPQDAPGQPGPPQIQGQPGAPGQPGVPAPYPPGYQGQVQGPNGIVIQPGGTPGGAYQGQPYQGQQGITGQPGIGQSGITGLPGVGSSPQPQQGQNGVNPRFPNQNGFQNQNGFPNQNGFQNQNGYPNSASNSQNGGIVPSGSPNGQQQAGLQIINDLLTKPRPGGLPGGGAQPGGMAVKGGIAGIASKYESQGIKIINERNKIQEWEFLYDFRKEAARQIDPQGTASPPGQSQKPANDVDSKPAGAR